MKFALVLILTLLIACGDGTEDITQEVSFDGGISQARRTLSADSIRGWLSSLTEIAGTSNKGPFYFQDDISAIEIWFPDGNQEFVDSVKVGNRLTLIGDIVLDSRGMVQIHPSQYFIRDSRQILPGATPLALDTVVSFRYQSALARIIGIESITPHELYWQANTVYQVSDGVSTANLYIDPDTDIPGKFVGSFLKNISAIITRDSLGNPIFVPRSIDDFTLTGFGFISGPTISNISSNSVKVNFVASAPADYTIQYGVFLNDSTPNITQSLSASIGATTYSVQLNGLQAATKYDLRVVLVNHDDDDEDALSVIINFTTL
ncbi:MAG: fibronectin type III domain-containing protein [Calditrichaeota bacterium]|nr:fibronectin type III domain-containing protein [Calditrichota bacterium]